MKKKLRDFSSRSLNSTRERGATPPEGVGNELNQPKLEPVEDAPIVTVIQLLEYALCGEQCNAILLERRTNLQFIAPTTLHTTMRSHKHPATPFQPIVHPPIHIDHLSPFLSLRGTMFRLPWSSEMPIGV